MACRPWASAMSSRMSTSVATGGLGLGGELAEQQQRRDAVLVPHVVGVDAVAERLLVAEGQALDPADPLEAGERLGVRLAGRGRQLPEQARGDDAAGVGALLALGEQGVREQRADLVAAEHPPAVRAGDGGGAPVGVGVVGDHDVGAVALGEGDRQVHRARLLGVGEGDGREVRVRLLLLLHDRRRVEAGGLEHPLDRHAADAVQRGVDDLEVARAVRRPARRRCRGSCRRSPPRGPCPARPRGTSATAPTAAMRAAISASAGGTIWLPSPR